jgi:ABC-type Fe3+-citrate transport system substrate-binding protein
MSPEEETDYNRIPKALNNIENKLNENSEKLTQFQSQLNTMETTEKRTWRANFLTMFGILLFSSGLAINAKQDSSYSIAVILCISIGFLVILIGWLWFERIQATKSSK